MRRSTATIRILYLVLMLILAASRTAAQTKGRSNPCCGLMSGKVYCYGGPILVGAAESEADTTMKVLDITNRSGTTSGDLQIFWQNVNYISDNINLTSTSRPQCVVISDQNRMIVNGGDSFGSDINIMYDALKNQWSAQPTYAEGSYDRRQIYWGSGSYVPGKGAAFYGGFEMFRFVPVVNDTWIPPNVDASIFRFNGNRRYIGYTQVTYFNVDNSSAPWSTALPLTTASNQFLAKHQSVFDPVTNMLLFMGGEYRNTTSAQPHSNLYSYIKTFNTLTNEWGTMNLTGDIPTPNRFYSTLTLLPSTNRHVLLYGGETNDAVVQDYCNVLNLDTKVWTRQTIAAPAGTFLQRSRHSSVLVNNNTLFVVWGIDLNKVAVGSMLILNTTNPEAITMSNKYVDPNAPNAAEDSNGNTFKPGDDAGVSTGLSSGAKAGIVVAAVVVVILGALVVWFYLRNKRTNERVKTQEEELTKHQQQAEHDNTSNVEPMEVDWDQIEKEYTEIPATKLANDNSEQFGSVPDNALLTTIVNGSKPDSTAAYAVHPDGVDMHRPNTMDVPPQAQRVLKPDGGY